MLKPIAFVFCLAAAISLLGQTGPNPFIIKVTGRSTSIDTAIGYGLQIGFLENSNKCDPVKGFLSLEDQINSFEVAAKAKGIDLSSMQAVVIKNNLGEYQRRKEFKLVQPTAALIAEVKAICDSLAITFEKTYYLLPHRSLADQDESAVMALQDANKQAEAIAKQNGMKVSKILSIDDEALPPKGIGTAGNYADFENPDFDRLNFLEESFFHERLDEFYSPENEIGYFLLVTYLLE